MVYYLVAIVNPFGLNKIVMPGYLSTLNREVQSGGSIRRKISDVPPAPSYYSVINGCIQTDATINPGNLVELLLDVKGGVVGMNTAIVTMSDSNARICFALPVNRFKPAVEDILSMDRLLRIMERKNAEGGNGGSPYLVWMGMYLVDKRKGI